MTLKNAEGVMMKADADRLNGGIFSMICVLIQCLSFCGVFLVNGLVNFKNVMCRVVIVVIVSVVSWLPWLKR